MTRLVRPKSLRRQLFVRLLGIVSSVWLIASVVSLWAAWDEAQEGHRGQAAHLAIAMTHAFGGGETGGKSEPLRKEASRDGIQDVFVVVWRGGREVYRSANAPDIVPQAVVAGTPLSSNGTTWLLASYRWAARDTSATVGLDERESILFSLETLGVIALPMFIGFILVVMAVFSGVRQSLAPVEELRRQILDRSPSDLEPVRIDAAPEELLPMIGSLNHLLQRLSHALQTERQFIADASHELRTPLAAIKAQVQAVDRAALGSEARARLDKIEMGVERAARLIEQLLALARSEAISSSATAVLLDLGEIAQVEIAEMFPTAVAAGIDVEFVRGRSLTRADPLEVAMLIRNLLDNAVRYAGRGALVRASTGCDEGRSWIVIEDSGPGMSDEDQANAFARFRRGATAQGIGSGLGLSIVNAAAHRYGGTVTLQRSTSLGGVAAFVSFPAE